MNGDDPEPEGIITQRFYCGKGDGQGEKRKSEHVNEETRYDIHGQDPEEDIDTGNVQSQEEVAQIGRDPADSKE